MPQMKQGMISLLTLSAMNLPEKYPFFSCEALSHAAYDKKQRHMKRIDPLLQRIVNKRTMAEYDKQNADPPGNIQIVFSFRLKRFHEWTISEVRPAQVLFFVRKPSSQAAQFADCGP